MSINGLPLGGQNFQNLPGSKGVGNDPQFDKTVSQALDAAFGANPQTGKVQPGPISTLMELLQNDFARDGSSLGNLFPGSSNPPGTAVPLNPLPQLLQPQGQGAGGFGGAGDPGNFSNAGSNGFSPTGAPGIPSAGSSPLGASGAGPLGGASPFSGAGPSRTAFASGPHGGMFSPMPANGGVVQQQENITINIGNGNSTQGGDNQGASPGQRGGLKEDNPMMGAMLQVFSMMMSMLSSLLGGGGLGGGDNPDSNSQNKSRLPEGATF